MTPLIILAAVAGATALVAFFLRVNAVFLFLGVAAGNLLVGSVSDDADLALGIVIKNDSTAVIASLLLMTLSVLFVLVFLRKTIPAHKTIIHLIPIIATSLMLSVLIIPLLPEGMADQVYDSVYGETIERTKDFIIAVASLLTLFLSWLGYRHKGEHKKGKKGK